MAITRKIGEKFQADDGTWLEVKEVFACNACYYEKIKCSGKIEEVIGECSSSYRTDNKDVYFKKTTPPEIKYSFADEKEFYHLDYFKSYLFHMQVDSVKLITSENKDVILVVKNRKPMEFEVVLNVV